jgi:hypothetical protein
MRRHSALPLRLLLAGALLAPFLLPGCGDADSALVLEPGRHDFGRVLWGSRSEARFTLTNHSDRTVAIRPKVNCGCFALAAGWRPALAPGESTECVVLYSSGAVPAGPLKGKFLVIESDHPDARERLAPLVGESFLAFELAPSEISYGRIDGRPENYEPRTIRLTPLRGYQVRLRGVTAAPPDFFTITERTEGDAIVLDVRLLKSAHRKQGTVFSAQLRISWEATTPEGEAIHNDSSVNLKGLWSLPDPPPKAAKGATDAG